MCVYGQDREIQAGKEGGGEEFGRTIHPAEAFARHHLEVNSLVAVLSVDKVREPDRVELLGYYTIEVNEGSCHPFPKQSDQ